MQHFDKLPIPLLKRKQRFEKVHHLMGGLKAEKHMMAIVWALGLHFSIMGQRAVLPWEATGTGRWGDMSAAAQARSYVSAEEKQAQPPTPRDPRDPLRSHKGTQRW